MAFKPGSIIQDRFLLTAMEQRTTKQGKKFYTLQLAHPEGAIAGTIWSEAIPRVKIVPDAVVYLEGKIDSYNGRTSLVVESGYTLADADPAEFLTAVKTTPTLIFDIETVGIPFADIAAESQRYLLERLERAETPTDQEAAKQKTGLYPLFGYVGAIGLLDTRQKGTVLLLNKSAVTMEDQRFSCEVFSTEKELLTRFWEIAAKYQRFVTYNGLSFDWPFLVFRSGVNRVKVSVPIRPWNKDENNLDLAVEIPPSRTMYKLSEVTKAMGLSNPKEAGVNGGDVTALFAAGQQSVVAQYVARDVSSTEQLYELWRTYLAGRTIV